MLHSLKIISLSSLLIFFSQTTLALTELRLTYGVLGTKDFATEACGSYCSSTPPGAIPLTGLGADLIISPPLIPFGFGVRYEKVGLSAALSGISVDSSIERVAVLINYRFIDTIVHFGPILSLGISTQSDLKISDNGTPSVHYTSTTSDSASAGLELTVKPLIVIPISVGLEGGYQYLNVRKAVDSLHNNTKDIDLSGIYFKALLSLDF